MNELELDRLLDEVLRETANPAPPQGLERRIALHMQTQRIHTEGTLQMNATRAGQPEDVPFQLPGFASDLAEQGLLASLWTSLRDLIAPPRLPELVLESRPLPIRTTWDRISGGRTSGGTWGALAVHALAILLITVLVSQKAEQLNHAKILSVLTAPMPPVLARVEPKPVHLTPHVEPPIVKTAKPRLNAAAVKPPEAPHVAELKMASPAISLATPAIKPAVVPVAAPRAVGVALPIKTNMSNRNPNPAPVALGHPDSPVAPARTPATSAVDLGQRGLQSMPAGNGGTGPASTAVQLGSGQPNGVAPSGPGAKRPIAGVKLGGVVVDAASAAGAGIGARSIELGQAIAEPVLKRPVAVAPSVSAPKVLYKPRPVYTAEATALHLEGVVAVRIKVLASGAVEVQGVGKGLGHGLDEAAIQSVRSMRFRPAQDAAGNPIDWLGVVNVTFQLAN